MSLDSPLPDVLTHSTVAPIEGAPRARVTVAPTTTDELAAVLADCSSAGLAVLIWGGGTHQGIGGTVDPAVIVSTQELGSVLNWRPDDLTLTIQGGTTVNTVIEHLDGQYPVLPIQDLNATVGGILASGVAGYDQLRMGPPRDHVLGLTMVTGDGRVVKAGGTVVKNVSGYDLMRLACGSLGAMGVIAEVVLKLWPEAPAKGMVPVTDARSSGMSAYRPTAVIETHKGAFVYLSGTEPEITSQAAALGGPLANGHQWPTLPSSPTIWNLNVPHDCLPGAIGMLSSSQPFIAQHLVGILTFGSNGDAAELLALRDWASSNGGTLTRVAASADHASVIDPWGAAPDGAAIQRRILASFDPAHILNPGRHPVSLP